MANFVRTVSDAHRVFTAKIPESVEDLLTFVAGLDQEIQEIHMQIYAWTQGQTPARDQAWHRSAELALRVRRKVCAAARRDLLRKTMEQNGEQAQIAIETQMRHQARELGIVKGKLDRERGERKHLVFRLEAEMRAAKAFMKARHPEDLRAFYDDCSAARDAYDAAQAEAADKVAA